MAVEIKEIVIRAVLSKTERADKLSESSALENEHVVQECVNQVLKILSKKNRR
ncbi:MAG: DUF5908 family protein [Algibacter sp.]